MDNAFMNHSVQVFKKKYEINNKYIHIYIYKINPCSSPSYFFSRYPLVLANDAID